MICVQIFLPLPAGRGGFRNRRLIADVQEELTQQFGGVTAYINTPAQGAWRKGRQTIKDQIVVVEVMTQRLSRPWWKRYKRELEQRFDQEEVVVRAASMDLL